MGRAARCSIAGTRSTLVSAAGSGGLQVRLVRAEADAASPFVVVHEGRYARILLAELVGPTGDAHLRFAWKLRVDQPPAGLHAPSNGELDRLWQQEREQLARVRAPNVVAPVAVPSALTESPPVFYCRHTDRYFHPVCPATGAVLTVCRDDDRLASAGLPPYGHDTVRYLHHGLDDGPLTFYRVDPPDGQDLAPGHGEQPDGVRIATQSELIREWLQLAREGKLSAEQLPCAADEQLLSPAGEDGVAPAERALHAVSFYDVDSMALDYAETDFATAMVQLGGGGGGAETGDGERAWMGGADSERRTMEVLRLKLAAFADVCRGVRAVHETGRPHLGISPTNVVAFEAETGSALPANWRMRFALTDLGGALPVHVPNTGETLWQPGREISEDETSRLFIAPSLRSLEGSTITMSVACRRLDGTGDVVVDVHRAGVPPFVLPGDLVIVEPVAGGARHCARVDEIGGRRLVAVLLDESATDERSIGEPPSDEPVRVETVVSGVPMGREASASASSAPAWAGTTFDARLTFARRSSPSADLYGLGMLLLRILLVHDEQTLTEVAASVERCIHDMSVAVAHADESDDLTARWLDILDGERGEGRFASWHVLQLRTERQAAFDAELQGQALVPPAIWRSLMALAGRLLMAPPVSRGGESGRAERPLVGVLAEVAAIERQLHVEVFDRPSRDAALIAACRQYAVGLQAQLAAKPVSSTTQIDLGGVVAARASTPEGFVLAVGRVGESAIEQHHFASERVTIGRREDDNVLQLADPMVSSRHAVIEHMDGEYVLLDRGSTNGTEVDGIRLPVEVPHPLDDGSVIHIRPFVLSFRRSELAGEATATVSLLRDEELREQLCIAYAEHAGRTEREVRQGLASVLDDARQAVGRNQLLRTLESLHRTLAGDSNPSVDGDDAPRAALAEAGLQTLAGMARDLVGAELQDPEQLRDFGQRVQRFVETTSRWIEDVDDWRRALGGQLTALAPDAAANEAGARPCTADDVLVSSLAGSGGGDRALPGFLDDIFVLLDALLRGNREARRAVCQRLDPERLVAAAGDEAKLRILVQAAAGSALWKLYTDTHAALAAELEGGEHASGGAGAGGSPGVESPS